MTAARAAFRASPEQRRWAASASLLAPLVELSLGLGGLDRTLRWIERLPRGTPEAVPLAVASSERAVSRAFRLQPWLSGRCLSRALVQHALHRQYGTAARLVIGVRRGADAPVEAHAWVDTAEGPAELHGYRPLLTVEALA